MGRVWLFVVVNNENIVIGMDVEMRQYGYHERSSSKE